jgi:methionyl aminopeptidase
MNIKIKTPQEIEKIRKSASILVEVMRKMKEMVEPGVKTKELDSWAEDFILKAGGKPAFKGMYGFPATLCISLNDEIVHGIPSDRKLKEGDIVSIDGGVKLDGWNSDMAITLPVGEISPEARRLMKCTKKALKRGIKKSKEGNTFGSVSNTIQRYIESQNYGVIKNLCGHGIGKELHEDPEILNYGKRHSGALIKEGMVFCLEPMLSIGKSGEIIQKENGAYSTKDGTLVAHFEHLIAIVNGRPEVITDLNN